MVGRSNQEAAGGAQGPGQAGCRRESYGPVKLGNGSEPVATMPQCRIQARSSGRPQEACQDAPGARRTRNPLMAPTDHHRVARKPGGGGLPAGASTPGGLRDRMSQRLSSFGRIPSDPVACRGEEEDTKKWSNAAKPPSSSCGMDRHYSAYSVLPAGDPFPNVNMNSFSPWRLTRLVQQHALSYEAFVTFQKQKNRRAYPSVSVVTEGSALFRL
jgi:hypothetical protein